MIDCRQVAEQLLRFKEGELPEAETEALRKHLHLCPPCVDLFDTYEEIVDVLHRLEPVCMPKSVMERLKAKCREAADSE